MKALVHLAFGDKIPDCTRCTRDERLRLVHGCDAPAEYPVLTVSCSACGGFAAECKLCDGKGSAPLYRCPRKLIESHSSGAQVERAFRLWLHYEAHGTLPYAGGMAQQSSSIVRMFDIASGEKALIDKERQEAAERERKREAMVAQAKAEGRMK